MTSNQTQKVIIVIKNKEMYKTTFSNQTKKMRESTNNKIRNLGNKFYEVKKIFEHLNIHRDVLFQVGKDLERQYKNIKKGIILQAKNKRMKESLICWFCDYFYDEITTHNSLILAQLTAAQYCYNIKSIGKNANKIITCHEKKETKTNAEKIIAESPIILQNIQLSTNNNTSLAYTKTNNEIDRFEFANISKQINEDNSDVLTNILNNFNF